VPFGVDVTGVDFLCPLSPPLLAGTNSVFLSVARSTALQVESIIRNNGSVPATIGIIDGTVYVGLHRQQLEQLALKGRWLAHYVASPKWRPN